MAVRGSLHLDPRVGGRLEAELGVLTRQHKSKAVGLAYLPWHLAGEHACPVVDATAATVTAILD